MVKLSLLASAAAIALTSGAASAQELVIWHDKGDDGLALVDALSEQFAASHPDVTVTSVSMPTDQWFSKSIAALNTRTGPDIIFNDNSRIATVMQSTGKLCNLSDIVEGLPADDRAHLNEGDIAAATLSGEVIMMPFQRVITGWGARKSWLDAVGEEFPLTWEDTLRVAKKFQEMDPDGNGKDDTYGMALQGGNAGSMVGAGTKLFAMGGNRAPHDLMTEEGEVTLSDPQVATPVEEYLKVYTDYRLVSPDTVNHTFTDMYQLIEGGRAGLFRVGNWNVGKWDREALKGDYVVGPFPSFDEGTEGAMLVGTVRGMAVVCDGENADLAKEFVKLIVTKDAQQASLDKMGGVVRGDLDISGVTPSLKPFVDGSYPLQTDDFMSAVHPWYQELIDAFYVELNNAVANPPSDWDAWIAETQEKLQSKVNELNG